MSSEYSTKEIHEKEIWEEFLTLCPESNFLQSWNWGRFNERLGKKVYRIGFFRSQRIVGAMLCIVEEAKRAKYITVPAGPIIDWDDSEVVSLFISELKRIAKSEKVAFVRVRPQLYATEDNKNRFISLGFKNSPMHLHAELTSQLDLTWSEEDILSGMRKNTRYEIRKAKKIGVKVSVTDDIENLKEFYDLQIETSKRQNFVPFSYQYLHEQFKVFRDDGQVLLYKAELDGKVLAQAFVIFYGTEAAYHYGASTEDGRKFPGAYAIQWAAIKEAKSRNILRYNFWGVAEPEDTGHRFYGVSVFKRGFGGKDIAYLHAQDLVISQFKYLKNWIIETIRKKVRHV